MGGAKGGARAARVSARSEASARRTAHGAGPAACAASPLRRGRVRSDIQGRNFASSCSFRCVKGSLRMLFHHQCAHTPPRRATSQAPAAPSGPSHPAAGGGPPLPPECVSVKKLVNGYSARGQGCSPGRASLPCELDFGHLLVLSRTRGNRGGPTPPTPPNPPVPPAPWRACARARGEARQRTGRKAQRPCAKRREESAEGTGGRQHRRAGGGARGGTGCRARPGTAPARRRAARAGTGA